jgi:hypothetical protein
VLREKSLFWFVPEPAMVVLFGIVLALLGAWAWSWCCTSYQLLAVVPSELQVPFLLLKASIGIPHATGPLW